jgi:hypothetical protein
MQGRHRGADVSRDGDAVRRWTRILALAFVLATSAVVTWAYWSQSGSGSASATTASLDAASISVPGSAINSVTVTWTAQSSLNPSSAANSAITYTVERRLGAGTWGALASGGCSGSKARGTTSCVDTPASAGSYTYRAVAAYHSWTATSNPAGPVTVTIDTTPPTVSSIVLADANPTNASSVHWTVTFSEPVTGVGSPDFALAATAGASGATISSVTGSGVSYAVAASTGSGDGTLGLNLVDDDTIIDAAANKLGGTGTGNGNLTGAIYTIDKTAPTAISIVSADPTPTNASTVHWTVSFSESVTGVDTGDFTLAAAGPSGASISSVTGSGAAYTVTVATGSGSGTLGVNLVDDDTIMDLVGLKLGGTGAGNGSLTGAIYTIDKTAPTVISLQMFDANTNGKVDRVTVTFSETLSSSTLTAPWTLVNVPSSGSLASVSTSGSVATLAITEGAGNADTAVGSLTVALAANSLGMRDTVGNQASFSASAPADAAAPARLSMSMFDVNTNGKVDRVTATFSESLVSTTLTAPWTLTSVPSSGSLATVSTAASVATLAITEGAGLADTAVGSFTIALAANASGIHDAAGNQASFTAIAPADNAGPVPIAISDGEGQIPLLQVDGLLQVGDTLVATFSEAIASGAPGSTPITEARGSSGNAFLTITGFTDGALDMSSANYAPLGLTVSFVGTSTLSNASKTVTITTGACSVGLCLNLLAGSGIGMIYKPATTLADVAGNAAAGTIVTGFKIY